MCRWCLVRETCCPFCTDSVAWPGLVCIRDATHDAACHLIAYAVPSPPALAEIASHAPIIEVGSGTGYWAVQLEAAGVDILAYDLYTKDNPHHGAGKCQQKVAHGGPERITRHRDRTLFLCMPPPDDPMAQNCLKLYTGSVLLYVGEWRGNTATREFEAALLAKWSLKKQIPLPNWGSDANVLMVWHRLPVGVGQGRVQELPCVCCTRVAERRCRLCREFVCCSKECMEAGSAEHAKIHAIKCVERNVSWDDKHFDKLEDLVQMVSTME